VKESIKIIPLPDLELSEYITLSTRLEAKTREHREAQHAMDRFMNMLKSKYHPIKEEDYAMKTIKILDNYMLLGTE
jgi:hypothetical protein